MIRNVNGTVPEIERRFTIFDPLEEVRVCVRVYVPEGYGDQAPTER
jgi:hypothetical protein